MFSLFFGMSSQQCNYWVREYETGIPEAYSRFSPNALASLQFLPQQGKRASLTTVSLELLISALVSFQFSAALSFALVS